MIAFPRRRVQQRLFQVRDPGHADVGGRECARMPAGELENGKSQMGGRAAEPEESVLGTTFRIIIYTLHVMVTIEGF